LLNQIILDFNYPKTFVLPFAPIS